MLSSHSLTSQQNWWLIKSFSIPALLLHWQSEFDPAHTKRGTWPIAVVNWIVRYDYVLDVEITPVVCSPLLLRIFVLIKYLSCRYHIRIYFLQLLVSFLYDLPVLLSVHTFSTLQQSLSASLAHFYILFCFWQLTRTGFPTQSTICDPRHGLSLVFISSSSPSILQNWNVLRLLSP